ncbi:MAG TPA: calcium-binding EGF-like domain-containing protein [Saprospiraceae bacterium]|jgi:hypothetical protein
MKPIQFMVAILLTLLSITSCQEDPCDTTPCENGGICNEGKCLCAEGYTGNQCQEKILPYRMRISSVTLTRFPASNDGMIWDDMDGPDIFFKIFEDTFPIGKPLELILDAPVDQSYDFSISVIEMRNITVKHSIKLYDYEGFNLTPEFMGEVEFIPFNAETGLPDSIVLDNGGPVAFVIGVTYLYPKETD